MAADPNIASLRDLYGYEPPRVQGLMEIRGKKSDEPLVDEIVAWCRVRKRHIARQELINEHLQATKIQEAKKADSDSMQRLQKYLAELEEKHPKTFGRGRDWRTED
jgi:hypothetical protein